MMAPGLGLLPAEVRQRMAHCLVLVLVLIVGCEPAGDSLLTSDLPLHLEDHLDAAVVRGSEIPEEIRGSVEWRFDEPQPEWRSATGAIPAGIPAPIVTQTGDALQITLGDLSDPRGRFVEGVFVDVPGWDQRDWAHVVVRARCSGPAELELGFNLLDPEEQRKTGRAFPFETWGRQTDTPLVGDSTVQTYQLPMEPSTEPLTESTWENPIDQFGLWFAATEPLTVEILWISVGPPDAVFAEEPIGVRHVERNDRYRRSLFMHTPGEVEFEVRVPEKGRLDTGLGTLWSEPSTTFRVKVRSDEGGSETLLEESLNDRDIWAQRSVDLSAYAGEVVSLSLEAESDRDGSVALWGAPTLTGSRATDKPNVIFYIIDGAGAEYMSLYGYNRRTTPNIDRLAAEGAVFERAYSNSSWTLPSTASFMTSLQHSALGGSRGGWNVVPEDVPTMAQHLHRGGYQTAVFTANPNAGRVSGLERGVDLHREDWTEFSYYGFGGYQESSKYLHEAFWHWREIYPGEPYWAHFQTVDIHGDFPAAAPFGGLYVSSEEAETWQKDFERLIRKEANWWAGLFRGLFDRAGLDRVRHYTVAQGLYDEAMAHNDFQVGRLVERLKAEGEWENTLLIIGADHSIKAAVADVAMFIQDSLPPAWNMPILRPSISRIPLLFVWPGHIQGGQRFSEPFVSMIDVLPTILDLVGLPLPEITQGQSLAPLLLGEGKVEPRPVILDEFTVDGETGEFRGKIEVIDGRWGASLEINPALPQGDEDELDAMWRRPVPLLLFDLWNDPHCLHSIHEERPDLVEEYTAFLEAQFEAHQALGQYFTLSEEVVLTPEQLEMLRTLGYIR